MADDREMERGFWHSILEAWEDDTPRLIYADWLDDHDRAERAEIIRAQCAAARLPKDDPRRTELDQRARDLLIQLLGDWAEEEACLYFERGFYARAHVHVPRFLRYAGQYETLGPIGEIMLNLPSWDELISPLEEGEVPPEVRYGGVEEFANLAECPAIANWRRLVFGWGGDYLDPACFAVLIKSPHLHALRSLSVYTTLAENDGLIAVASAPALGGLRELHLGNFFSYSSQGTADAGTQALANSPYLTRLEKLSFSVHRVRDEIGAELVGTRNFAALRSLQFHTDGLGDATVEAIVRSPHLGQLEELRLTGSAGLWNDTQVRQLLGWPGLARLNRLSLVGSPGLSDSALRLLAGSAAIRSLKQLVLVGREITPEGIAVLVSSPNLGALETLAIASVRVGDIGVAALLASPFLGYLCRLDITSSPEARISPANIEALRQRLGRGLRLIERQ
jgi:uncharacterized protein (TIGR02996 family)